MKNKHYTPTGPILILIGTILIMIGFAVPILVSIITINTWTPVVFSAYPNGTSTAPQVIPMSANLTIWEICYGYTVDSAYVDITPAGSETTRVALSPDYTKGFPASNYLYYYSAPWTSPSTSGTTITFVWSLENNGLIGTYTSYAVATLVSGDFYINNQKITKDAAVTLNTRTLSFKFVATTGTSQVLSSLIEIWNSSGSDLLAQYSLTKQSDGITWGGASWTAPSDGTYIIYGYMGYSGGNSRLLSILDTIGTPSEEEISMWTWVQIAGAFIIVIGVINTGISTRMIKKRR